MSRTVSVTVLDLCQLLDAIEYYAKEAGQYANFDRSLVGQLRELLPDHLKGSIAETLNISSATD